MGTGSVSRFAPAASDSGFTLIELMVGLAIFAVVIAMGLPSYSQWIQNSQIRNTAESILNGLQLARAEAVGRNREVRLDLDGSGAWSVCVGNSSACAISIQERPAAEGSSSQVTVDAALIVFNGLGQASAGAPANINVSNPSAAQSRSLRVTADTGGALRICDPSVTATDDLRKC